MIYARMGLSEPLVRSNIVIDYSNSKTHVYEDIARYFFGRCEDLSFLAFVENTDLESRLGMPTQVLHSEPKVPGADRTVVGRAGGHWPAQLRQLAAFASGTRRGWLDRKKSA